MGGLPNFKHSLAHFGPKAMLLLALLCQASVALASDSAVGLVYHRFGEADFPATNTTLHQLDEHISLIQSGGHRVLPLGDIITALKAGEPLPEKALAITIDDAFLSVFEAAWPRFKAAGFPITIFVSTQSLDSEAPAFMSWDQLRTLAAEEGVTIGAHAHSHSHMAGMSQDQALSEMALANTRLLEELEVRPSLFAYPYGEASLATMAAAEKAGYDAAFGQHSGAMGGSGSFYYLPRYALNEAYGGTDRVRTAIKSLPLPVHSLTPTDPVLEESRPAFGFTVATEVTEDLKTLRCYASHEGLLKTELLGRRIEARLSQDFPKGRNRINCTLYHGEGRWRWFGRQFLAP